MVINLFPESDRPQPTLLKVGKTEYQFPMAAKEIQILDEQGQLLWQKTRDPNTGPIRWQGKNAEGKLIESGDYVCKVIYPDGKSVDIPFNFSK
jgi:hypothetical protein